MFPLLSDANQQSIIYRYYTSNLNICKVYSLHFIIFSLHFLFIVKTSAFYKIDSLNKNTDKENISEFGMAFQKKAKDFEDCLTAVCAKSIHYDYIMFLYFLQTHILKSSHFISICLQNRNFLIILYNIKSILIQPFFLSHHSFILFGNLIF